MRPRAAQKIAAAPARPPFRRKYLVEALEPRVLLSADLPVVPPPPPPDPHPQFSPDADSMAFPALAEIMSGRPGLPQTDFDGDSMAFPGLTEIMSGQSQPGHDADSMAFP